jgi:hypothetical protein
MTAIYNAQKETENEDNVTTERESNDKVVIEILEDICKDNPIVKTRDNNYYVQLENPIDGNKKTYSFNESDFQDFVRVKFFEKTDRYVNTSKLNDGIATFKAILNHQESARLDIVDRLSNRIHGNINTGEFLYDLATDTGEVVKITPEGWKIVHLDRPVFRKSTNILPQVMPIQDNNSEESCDTKTFWNRLYEEPLFLPVMRDYRLFIVYLVYCFIPQLSKPILILRGDNEEDDEGEGGSGKSTLIKYIKQIVDPSSSELSSIPKDVKDLKILLSESQYIPFDNVTHIHTEVSDTLCQAVTGGTLSNRRLYTNNDLNTIRYKNSVAVNGIHLRKLKPDLRDRAIIFDMERIDDFARRTETEIEERFNKLLPELLKRIFDIISMVMKYILDNPQEVNKIKISNLPRMADFALYGEIISRVVFGEKNKNEFLDYYKNKVIAQNGNWGTDGKDLENHSVVQALMKLNDILEGKSPLREDDPIGTHLTWEGSCTELYDLLSRIILNYKILNAVEIKDPKLFPQAANSMSRVLNTLQPVLNRKGIDFMQFRAKNAKRDKVINLSFQYSTEGIQVAEQNELIVQSI